MEERGSEKEPGTFGNLYHLARDFLRDFWRESRKGTLRHKKGMVVFFAFVFLCFAAFVVAAYKLSETPAFCGVCHNMKVYVDSWKASSHKKVGCIECHYKPGFTNHLKGKWRDGQLSLAYFITGKSPTKPHAEIDDATCLQSKCHKRDDLKRDVVFKNVIFSHPQHIEQMRRQKQLRCATCHSQIVQGAHMIVTDVECFICHFYKTKGQKEYITGCGACHFEARGDIKVSRDFTFNHRNYIQRGIKCERCHTNVISGDGNVRELVCLQCHNKREMVEKQYTPEVLHKNHVTDHKVECFNCHSAIKHQIVGLHYKGQPAEGCSECHLAGKHVEKVNMYLGKGARLVEDHPNRMSIISMDCNVCHESWQGPKPLRTNCRDCHGTLTDGMLDQWEKLLKDNLQQLNKKISEVKASAEKRSLDKASKKKLDDAIHNYDFLVKGNGIHNIVYAMKIAQATRNALQEVEVKEKGESAKLVAFKLSCTGICHVDIADRKVPFGKVTFPHSIHAEGEDSCLKCHSEYAVHGQTRIKGCAECHHGEGMGKVRCQDCHRAEEKMFTGRGVKDVKEMRDWMRGTVTCRQCHVSVKQGKKESIASIKTACAACHGKQYQTLVEDWAAQGKNIRTQYTEKLDAYEKDVVAIETKDGRHSVPLRAALDEIRQDMNFVLDGNWSHNPQYAEAIVAKISRNVEALDEMIKTKKAGKEIFLSVPRKAAAGAGAAGKR
jgi:hypothetical protein